MLSGYVVSDDQASVITAESKKGRRGFRRKLLFVFGFRRDFFLADQHTFGWKAGIRLHTDDYQRDHKYYSFMDA
ncbi:hypothetical protein HYT00_01790 [Candidatus Giovannonibacteria bacterium]|nr:hypothetical protein [Candidatus Giovannonibacteria bacterium]